MLNNLIKQNVNIDRNKNWESFLSKLPTGSKRCWAIMKMLNDNNIPFLSHNNQDIYDDKRKAELIADQFEKSHKLTINYNSPFEKKVKSCIKVIERSDGLNTDISTHTNLDEISSIIKSLKNNKAPGWDGISNILLKKASSRCKQVSSQPI